MAGGPSAIPTPDVHAANLYNELVGATNPEQDILAKVAKAHQIFRNAGASGSQLQEAVKYMAEGKQLAEKNREAAALAQRKTNAKTEIDNLRIMDQTARDTHIASYRTANAANPGALAVMEDAIRFEEEDRRAMVTQLQKDVADKKITRDEARSKAAASGNVLLEQSVKKAMIDLDIADAKKDLDEGKVTLADLRAGLTTVPPTVATEVYTAAQEHQFEKEDEKIRKALADGSISMTDARNYANLNGRTKFRTELSSDKYLANNQVESAFSLTSTNVSSLEANIGLIPGFANLPADVQTALKSDITDFKELLIQRAKIDDASLKRMEWQVKQKQAEQLNYAWERIKKHAAFGIKLSPVLLLGLLGPQVGLPMLAAAGVAGTVGIGGGVALRNALFGNKDVAELRVKGAEAKEEEEKLKLAYQYYEKTLPKARKQDAGEFVNGRVVDIVAKATGKSREEVMKVAENISGIKVNKQINDAFAAQYRAIQYAQPNLAIPSN